MKSLAVLALLFGFLSIWLVTGSNDRTRDNCQPQPTAPRCKVTP